ncbi:ATP-binding protein [Nocardioides sp. SYSU D00065]|uniref:ATP-binding protein n=1 Tax=Nocardioides sp. SYSU D00065 TaxID=2817378 RepID=UPI001B3447E8|nr:ATP-binding protein [Nocardioides sp. SYSU D00065]
MTQDAAQSRKGAGMSVAGWPLRRKIALALAIPLLLAATLGGLRVLGDYSDSREAASSAKQVTIIQPAVDYLTASEAAMVAAQSDDAASQGDLIDAIADISTNAEALTEARDSADLTDLQVAHVNALLDLSQAMRGEGAESLGPATWIALVRQLESSVTQLITSVNAAQDTPEPRLEQLSQAMSGRLSLALQQGLIATTLSQSSSQDLFSEIGVEAAAIDRLAGSVEGAEEQTALLRTQNTRHAGQVRDDSASDLGGRDAYAPYDEITASLISGVSDTLDEAASDAQRNALLGAALTLLALAAAIAIAFVIARSLLDPIGRVREGALAVARHRLPDAVARIRAGQEPEPIKTIDVTTNEEIGQVARAVDDLHRQAIHLASGEAQLRQTVNAMFVTLSRRSTSLVNQQLAQIERLEHDEEDPKRLESLFRLDHLASRMRRTADSLLILADAPNRAAGTYSLTVGEALQAATSGVQDYQRVQILSHLGTRVSDDAAPDVVHLLTELVDNALTYSPPAEPVRLAAKLGADGVTVTITDAGLGVPPAELEQLNRDLAHGAEATPDTARRMGLFVVSRLAERHGIHASLARNAGGGMTATVLLPPAILPELPQSTPAPQAAPDAAQPVPATVAAPEAEILETTAVAAPAGARRSARKPSRAERAEAKAAEKAEKAAAAQAKAARDAEAQSAPQPVQPEPVQPEPAQPSPQPVARTAAVPSVTEDRPPLESLLPRREPGANMPRTGADAFLPPETSSATGPLFGKRPSPAGESATAAGAGSADAPVPAAASRAEKVASVVPITALASRQRAQAEEAKVEPTAPQPTAPATPPTTPPTTPPVTQQSVAEPVVQPPAQPAVEPEPARAHDPLSRSVPTGAGDRATAVDPADEVQVDVDDPLGLGTPTRRVTPPVAEPVAQPVAPPAAQPVADVPAASLGTDHGTNGLSQDRGAPARAGGDSPIFKSMRSGWLTGDASAIHETEVDRGWEIAEQVAEETPAVEATPAGLPRRAPGERLVPGSVTPPTAAKTRDPEAIRRRLQAHTAGVSRGRRAAQSSPQHTEAGPV